MAADEPSDSMPERSRVSLSALAGEIAPWIHCHQCDYPLTGLPPDGRCPECGTPASESTRPTVLRQIPLRYVINLRRSVGAVCVALVASTSSLLTLTLGWEVLCLSGPVLLVAAGLSIIWTDMPARHVPAPVELAAHSFATSVFVIPLFVPFLAAVSTGVINAVGSGSLYYDEEAWLVLALGRFFIGLGAGLVPYYLLCPLGTYARLLGQAFADHPGSVTPRRTASIRSNVRIVQVLGIAAGFVATVERSLAPGTVAYVFALATVFSLLVVVGQMSLTLRDARRILARAEAEWRRRAQS